MISAPPIPSAARRRHDFGVRSRRRPSETRRVAEEYGFRSVFLRSNIVNGNNWYDPYYEPLWNPLEELDLPLGFHEASASRSRQAAEHFEPNFGFRRVYAQPFEQMIGLGAFIGGGILERHPKMRVAFLEANCSWLPWLFWRMDEGYEREGDIFMPDLMMKPSEYFRRQCWISVEPDETPARYTIEEFGCDQLVFSTDYPHGDSKYPNAVESFLELTCPTTRSARSFGTTARAFTAPEIDRAPQIPNTASKPTTDPNQGGNHGNPNRVAITDPTSKTLKTDLSARHASCSPKKPISTNAGTRCGPFWRSYWPIPN